MSEEDDDEDAEDDAAVDSEQTEDTVPKIQHVQGSQVDLYLQNPDDKTVKKKGKFLRVATLTVADPQPKIPHSFHAANDQQTEPGDYIMNIESRFFRTNYEYSEQGFSTITFERNGDSQNQEHHLDQEVGEHL